MLKSISKSSIETYFQCQQKWNYTYVKGIEPATSQSKDQRFGSGVHKALEYLWNGRDVDWAAIDLDGGDKLAASAILSGYAVRYLVPPDVIGAEIPFNLKHIHGIFDAVYRDGDKVIVVEHKTTKTDFSSEWNASYWEKLRFDWQVGFYQLAAREVYQTDKVSILYDVLRTPQLRQKKGEASAEFQERLRQDIAEQPDRYFARAEIVWSDSALRDLEEDIKATVNAIAFETSVKKSRRCYEYNQPCGFIPVCFSGASLQDEKLYRIREKRQ